MTEEISAQSLQMMQAFFENETALSTLTNAEIEQYNKDGLNLPLHPETENPAPSTPSTYVDIDGQWPIQKLIDEALGRVHLGRNNTGMWLACQIRDEGYTQSEAEGAITDYQARVPDPASYAQSEALASVAQAYKRSPRDKRQRRATYTQTDTGYAYGFTGEGTWTPTELPLDQLTGIYLAYPQSDQGNAKCLLHTFPNRYLYCETYGWMYYTGSHWENENADARLKQDINKVLDWRMDAFRNAGLDYNGVITGMARNVRGCIFHAQPEITVSVSEFDNEPDMINCQNGVVDLMTGELIEHHPDQRFTYCVKRNYDPYMDFSKWREWLIETVKGGESVADYLQLAVGYSLTGYTREEVLFYIYGPPRSGKGTFTETVLAMFGRTLSKEVDFQTFVEKRGGDTQNFDLAPLKPTRFVAASESGKYQQLDSPRVKSIVGGNEISCAFKHKNLFTYRPQFKIWLSSNNNVNADVDDSAIWARLRVIEFPHSHVGKEDKHLKQRMKTDASLDAVFSWAVWGAVRWFMSEGGLHVPETVKQSTDEARDSVDYVQQFIDEVMLQFDEQLPKDATPKQIQDRETRKTAFNQKLKTAYITNADLYFEYKKWCDENGVTPKHKRSLSFALSSKGYEIGKQMRVEGKKNRCVIGMTTAITPTFSDAE